MFFKRLLDWEFEGERKTDLFLNNLGPEIIVSLSIDKAGCSDLRIFAATQVLMSQICPLP